LNLLDHITRIDHVQICIEPNQEEAARDFYCEKLGLIEIEKPESLKGRGGIWVSLGSMKLHIGTEKIPQKSKGHPAFEVSDLKLVRKQLTDLEIPIKEAINIPNINRFYFMDPFGNRIELLQREIL